MTARHRCVVILPFERTWNMCVDTENSKQEKPQLSPLTLTESADGTQHDILHETLVGREVECGIALDSPHVSRYHAKIIVAPEGATIEDLNSSNGTFVNGKRISEPTKISLGDEIRFDDLAFRLTSKEAGKSEATVVMKREALVEAAAATLQGGRGNAEPSPKTTEAEVNEQAAAIDEPEGDSTKLLSSDQIANIAAINQKLQQFTDTGSGPRFVATTAPIRGKVFKLDSKVTSNTWRFGRSKECELCVSAPSVSRRHGIIRKEDSRFYFSAEKGKSIRVNGVEQTEVLLKHNDQILVGPLEFIFRLDEPKTPPPQVITEPEEEHSYKQIIPIAIVTAIVTLLLITYLQFTGS